MSEMFQVDLDNEKIYVDNRWFSKTELSKLLTERLTSMDYSIATLSQAVETLDLSMKKAEIFSLRLSPELALQLRGVAQKKSQPPAALIREVLIGYLTGKR